MADTINEAFDPNDEDSVIVEMLDEETGEKYKLAMVDDFDLNGSTYCVLLTMEDDGSIDDDTTELVIVKLVTGADGEVMLESLDPNEEDIIYDYYDALCDESLESDEDDESEE